MNNYMKKYRKAMLIILCLIMLSPLVLISIYSRPASDDYGYSKFIINIVRDENSSFFDLIKGTMDASKYVFDHIDGTYLSNPIKLLQPGIWGEQYYCFGALILFAFIFVSLIFTLKNLHDIFDYKYNTCLEALVIMIVLLAGIPGIRESIYWFNGAWNYTPFFFLTLYNASFITKNMLLKDKTNKKSIIVSSIIAFICSGGNYIVSYLSIMMIFSFLILDIRKKKFSISIPLVMALISFAIEFFAPGRRAKQDAYIGILGTIKCSLVTTKNNLCQWMNIQWFFWVILFIIIGFQIKDKILPKISPIVFFTLSYLLLFALQCMPFYGQGIAGEIRVTNIFWMTFMILSAMNGVYITSWFISKYHFEMKHTISELFISIMLLCIIGGSSYYTTSNSRIALMELTDGTAKQFAAQCDARYEAMRNAEPGSELETQPLIKSKILFVADVTNDLEHWRNTSWKKYYGVGMHTPD